MIRSVVMPASSEQGEQPELGACWRLPSRPTQWRVHSTSSAGGSRAVSAPRDSPWASVALRSPAGMTGNASRYRTDSWKCYYEHLYCAPDRLLKPRRRVHRLTEGRELSLLRRIGGGAVVTQARRTLRPCHELTESLGGGIQSMMPHLIAHLFRNKAYARLEVHKDKGRPGKCDP